VWIKNSTIKAC